MIHIKEKYLGRSPNWSNRSREGPDGQTEYLTSSRRNQVRQISLTNSLQHTTDPSRIHHQIQRYPDKILMSLQYESYQRTSCKIFLKTDGDLNSIKRRSDWIGWKILWALKSAGSHLTASREIQGGVTFSGCVFLWVFSSRGEMMWVRSWKDSDSFVVGIMIL